MFSLIQRTVTRAFLTLGVLLTGLLLTGFFLDLSSFDRTRGGYQAPYTEFTGTPTDWSLADRTASGMARRGYVTTMLVNCTTGMISVEAFRQEIQFRVFSPRAIAVHKPREACSELGFQPTF